uniref:Uncharacterized protein n=1 Tax=Panagrolaimus davidi TaxID=227884 RepID=A0A914Q9H0_9BILA
MNVLRTNNRIISDRNSKLADIETAYTGDNAADDATSGNHGISQIISAPTKSQKKISLMFVHVLFVFFSTRTPSQ